MQTCVEYLMCLMHFIQDSDSSEVMICHASRLFFLLCDFYSPHHVRGTQRYAISN